MPPAHSWLYPVWALIALFAPGYIIAALLRADLPRDLRTALVCAISVFAFAAIVWLGYVLALPLVPLCRGTLLGALVGAVFVGWLRRWSPDWKLVGGTLLIALHATCYQYQLPIYCGGGWFSDWAVHYDTTRIYFDRLPPETDHVGGGYSLLSRTPVFNLWLAGLWAAVGEEQLWVYQGGAALLSALGAMGAVLVARRLFGPPTASLFWAACLFLPVVMKNTTYPWPKMLAAFYVLVGLAWMLDVRSGKGVPAPIWLGLLCGGGYMAHQSAVAYAGFLGIWVWLAGRWAAIARWVVAGLLVILPWHLWGAIELGPAVLWRSNPVLAKSEMHTLPGVVWTKTLNAVHTLLPARLFWRVLDVESQDYGMGLFDGYLAYQYGTLPGNLGLPLAVLMLVRGRRGLPHSPPVRLAAAWVVSGFVVGILIHPLNVEDNGLSQVTMQAAALVGAVLAVSLLRTLEPTVAALLFIGLAIEHIAMAWELVTLLHWGVEMPLLLGNQRLAGLLEITFVPKAYPMLSNGAAWVAHAVSGFALGYALWRLGIFTRAGSS